MSKQIIDLNLLPDFVASQLGTSKVIVEKNNSILTIEPMLADNSDSTNLENYVDETKAGMVSVDDFTEIKLFTKGYKFNRDDAYERN
jgi:hypothetical protein